MQTQNIALSTYCRRIANILTTSAGAIRVPIILCRPENREKGEGEIFSEKNLHKTGYITISPRLPVVPAVNTPAGSVCAAQPAPHAAPVAPNGTVHSIHVT